MQTFHTEIAQMRETEAMLQESALAFGAFIDLISRDDEKTMNIGSYGLQLLLKPVMANLKTGIELVSRTQSSMKQKQEANDDMFEHAGRVEIMKKLALSEQNLNMSDESLINCTASMGKAKKSAA